MSEGPDYDTRDQEGSDIGHCPACGEPIDYCQGHGQVGDPTGANILDAHDNGDHSMCHPLGCEVAATDHPSRKDEPTAKVLIGSGTRNDLHELVKLLEQVGSKAEVVVEDMEEEYSTADTIRYHLIANEVAQSAYRYRDFLRNMEKWETGEKIEDHGDEGIVNLAP